MSLDELTVMSPKRDPFRLDVEEMRAAGQWFADHHAKHIGEEKHLREIHYVLGSLNLVKPKNGGIYRNRWPDWRWLINTAAKAARWLGFVAFADVIDARNPPPTLNRLPRREGEPEGEIYFQLPVPDEMSVRPDPVLSQFTAEQPCALAIFSEKNSPDPVVRPIAERFKADWYPSIGDMVDRRLWEIASSADQDGRKLILFTLSDCDPAGYGMPITVARKLQAIKVLEFPDLEFEVVRIGLTPAQVKALELPSTPLKRAEKRAGAWFAAFGIEQTELDAAIALKRQEFAALIEAAVAPYFDSTLAAREQAARRLWREEAERRIDALLDNDEIDELQDRYDAARAEIEAINDRLSEIVDELELPEPPELPEPELSGERNPLIDSEWGFVAGTLRLKAGRAYEGEGDDDAEGDEGDEP
jgi:hypothetical protein